MIFVICLFLYGESFNGWGGGCRKFVEVWGEDGIILSSPGPPGDINDQSPGGMS